MVIAETYLNEILETFAFAEKRGFTQIATVANETGEYLPKLRTVLLDYVPHLEAFCFSCSRTTEKWQQLQQTPKVNGLYLGVPNTKQYRFAATVELIDADTIEQQILYRQTWLQTRPDLRHVLWQEYLQDRKLEYDIEQTCPDFGTVLLFPYSWDIFQLNTQDFAASARTQMVLKDKKWQVFEHTPNIHPLKL